jgi:hypothetical protein
MAISVDALAAQFEALSMSDAAEAQLSELRAFCVVEATPGEARNHLIHRIEDKDHRFPHAVSDLRKVSPLIDTALIDAAVDAPLIVDGAVVRAMFVVRLLDFCREHFYLLDSAEQTRLHALPEVIRFMAAIGKAYPALEDEKRKNQLRNFLVRDCGQKWAYAALNKVSTLEDALLVLKRRFYGSQKYRTAEEVYRAAIDSGKVAGLDDFGQTLHILKSISLKTRDGDTAALVGKTRTLLSAVNIDTLIALARSIANEAGGLCYVALSKSASDAQIAAVRMLEDDEKAYAAGVKALTYTATVSNLGNLPDIGALLSDTAFVRSV